MIHKVIDIELNIEDSQLIKNAEDQATKELTRALKEQIFDKRYSWSKDSTVLSEKAEQIVKDWLSENKADIYEVVAQKVATSMMRSGKFRDILEGKLGQDGKDE